MSARQLDSKEEMTSECGVGVSGTWVAGPTTHETSSPEARVQSPVDQRRVGDAVLALSCMESTLSFDVFVAFSLRRLRLACLFFLVMSQRSHWANCRVESAGTERTMVGYPTRWEKKSRSGHHDLHRLDTSQAPLDRATVRMWDWTGME